MSMGEVMFALGLLFAALAVIETVEVFISKRRPPKDTYSPHCLCCGRYTKYGALKSYRGLD